MAWFVKLAENWMVNMFSFGSSEDCRFAVLQDHRPAPDLDTGLAVAWQLGVISTIFDKITLRYSV